MLNTKSVIYISSCLASMNMQQDTRSLFPLNYFGSVYIRLFSYLFVYSYSLQGLETIFFSLDKWILFPSAFL